MEKSICNVNSGEKILHLTLKKKWFDMIASGEKKEEYREIKFHWFERLVFKYQEVFKYCTGYDYGDNIYRKQGVSFICSKRRDRFGFNPFDVVVFKNGYLKNAPTIAVECLGIEIGKAKPEWSDNWQGDVFVIKLGKIISVTPKGRVDSLNKEGETKI